MPAKPADRGASISIMSLNTDVLSAGFARLLSAGHLQR
jgi:hypothetical protein